MSQGQLNDPSSLKIQLRWRQSISKGFKQSHLLEGWIKIRATEFPPGLLTVDTSS